MLFSFIFIDQELNELEDYCRVMERAVVRYRGETEEWFKSQTAGMDDVAKSDFFTFHEDDWLAAEGTFPQILRSSLFVACYSTLEVKLEELCQGCKRRMELRLPSSDLKGQGVYRSRAYLKKVAGVAFPDESPTWNAISSLTNIRNVVVHMRGKLAENDASRAARNFAETHPDLTSVGDRDQLMLSDKFCPFVIETLRQFLKELVKAMAKPGDMRSGALGTRH